MGGFVLVQRGAKRFFKRHHGASEVNGAAPGVVIRLNLEAEFLGKVLHHRNGGRIGTVHVRELLAGDRFVSEAEPGGVDGRCGTHDHRDGDVLMLGQNLRGDHLGGGKGKPRIAFGGEGFAFTPGQGNSVLRGESSGWHVGASFRDLISEMPGHLNSCARGPVRKWRIGTSGEHTTANVQVLPTCIQRHTARVFE